MVVLQDEDEECVIANFAATLYCCKVQLKSYLMMKPCGIIKILIIGLDVGC